MVGVILVLSHTDKTPKLLSDSYEIFTFE